MTARIWKPDELTLLRATCQTTEGQRTKTEYWRAVWRPMAHLGFSVDQVRLRAGVLGLQAKVATTGKRWTWYRDDRSA